MIRVKGAVVHNITNWGVVTSQQDVSKARNEMLKVRDAKDVAVVLDLFGNSAYRYEQQDGNLAMPCKVSGKYHLPGKISTLGDRAMNSLISSARPLLELLPKATKVILPLLPRFVFGSCCEDPDHGNNTRDTDNPRNTLGDPAHLRKIIKQKVSTISGKCWVMDPVTACLAVPCSSTTEEKIAVLRQVTAIDNVHYTVEGYNNLGANLVTCLTDIQSGKICREKDTAGISVTGAAGPVLNHWKGFLSIKKADRKQVVHQNRKGAARAAAHPYKKAPAGFIGLAGFIGFSRVHWLQPGSLAKPGSLALAGFIGSAGFIGKNM